jgi:SagB-type dehydrogenase family enzyme
MTAPVPTAEFASLVFGPAGVALDDPAETFHEASCLYPGVAPGRLQTMVDLAPNRALQDTVGRASFTREHLATTALPETCFSRAGLRHALDARRSLPPPQSAPLPLDVLACVLGSAYRSVAGRRPVPSGGALYPLELYVVALDVNQLESGVHHYNPYRHCLERLRACGRAGVGEALVSPELAEHAAALIVVTAFFWRTRFKYGLRGYRFALLEAGHVVQNTVLVAAALRVPALPLGGFYDRLLDGLVGADGLHEASVYAVLLGGRT